MFVERHMAAEFGVSRCVFMIEAGLEEVKLCALGKDVATLMHVWFERHWLCLLAGTGGVFSMFMARLFFVKHICV